MCEQTPGSGEQTTLACTNPPWLASKSRSTKQLGLRKKTHWTRSITLSLKFRGEGTALMADGQQGLESPFIQNEIKPKFSDEWGG